VKALFVLLALTLVAAAEDPVVRATTRVMADGSKATTITDRDQKTAIETVVDAGGKMMRKIFYTLDETGQSTGAIHYDAKGNVRYKEAYKRDGAGQISASYLYSKDDKLLGHRTYVYSGKDVVIDDYDAAGKPIPKAPVAGKKKR
jgi:hypothetical protein